jgi:hypothetical protein
MSTVRRSVLPLALPLALVFAFVAGACSSASSEAGRGFRLGSDQLTPESTTTTVPPKPSFTTTVASANGDVLEVFAEKPSADGSATAAPAGSVVGRPGPDGVIHPPIPREGLNSANVRKTATGWEFDNPTYFGNPLTMVSTGQEGEWVKVQIPARPNFQEGWVRAADVSLSEHRFHAKLTLSDFTLRVWDGEDVVVETQVVIGKDSTPTPTGLFYFAEKIQQSSSGGAYGPWILPTNGYSEAMDFFDGGLPVIAFHGTNQPGLIGSQASNGCIRLPNAVITQLADTLPAGTPVEIADA